MDQPEVRVGDAERRLVDDRLLAEMGGSLPTADQLGDELERFLAEQVEDGPGPGPSGS